MIAELVPRTQDGRCDGKKLVPGKALPDVRPEPLETSLQLPQETEAK
jgi:hypothetical protein